MSEIGDMRRDDMQRDETMAAVPPEATTGDVRRDDATGDVGGQGTMSGSDDMRQNGPATGATLTTDQIANPGTAPSTAPPAAGGDTAEAEAAQLLDPQDRDAMTQRWRDIQANFVDQPRQAMQDADALVAGLMQQLAQMFSQERAQLEGQWSRGDEVSTEDLRVSLQRYRAFFERLLSV
jgi:hypothetical protein